MNSIVPNSYKYYTISIKIIVLASLVTCGWGFMGAPTVVKLLYSLLMWSSFIFFPWGWIKSCDFSRLGKLLLGGMLFWGAFEILRSLLGFSIDPNTIGNRYVTLLFNEYCAFIFFPPLFAYTIAKYNVLPVLFRCAKIYILGGIALSLFFLKLVALSWLATSIMVFWKYVSHKNRMYIIIVFFAAFINALLGGRVLFIFILYSAAAYFSCYYRDFRRLRKFICIISVFFPLFAFAPLLSSSANKDDSGFKVILNYVSKELGGDDDLNADTRTFLYLEMAVDLTKHNAWIMGKGANSTYFSEYFLQVSGGDHYIRLISEVPVLLFLLRGGIVYALLYLSFFLLCIYKAVWKGKSRFINCIGIMLAGWFANLFVGDVNGFTFFHVIIFSLCGMTLSRMWLDKTDVEIKKLINTRSLVRL